MVEKLIFMTKNGKQNKNTIGPDYQKFDSKILFYKNVFASQRRFFPKDKQNRIESDNDRKGWKAGRSN